MQVDAAWDYLTRTSTADVPGLRYEVTVSGGDARGRVRGIYLREPHETARASSFTVSVTPKLHEVCSCVCCLVVL